MDEVVRGEIARAISRFHRNEQGCEPARTEAFLLPDLVLVRCHDVFTATERALLETTEGRKLIQSARRDQRTLSRRAIEAEVATIIGRPVVRSFYDIDTRNGEQVEVYVLG